MRQNNTAIGGAVLGLFIYSFLPNVSAFFGGSAAYKSSRWSNSNYCKQNIGGNLYSASNMALSAAPTLLADPMPNSIGNFFENKTDGMSFIQCYMLSVAVVDGLQYGNSC